MLNQKEILYALADVADADVEQTAQTLGYLRAARRRGVRKAARVLLIAALLTALFAATAYAAGWLGLRERVSDAPVTLLDPETGAPVDAGESGMLSNSAYAADPAGQAHAEWVAFLRDYRAAYWESAHSNNDAENWHPDDPELQKTAVCYGVYDQAGLDKLLEIRDRYGVTLHTDLAVPRGTQSFLTVTGLEPFMLCDGGMAGWGAGYVYEDGSYHYEGGTARLADGSSVDFTVDCGRRGALDPAYLPVIHMEDYTEREYVNANGDTVVLCVAEGHRSSFLFYEGREYLITVRSDSEQAEALADCFDFAAMSALRPDLSSLLDSAPTAAQARSGLLTLADFVETDEYKAASAFQTLYNDYYLPIANEWLAAIGSHHPEGYSELYYYGGFPTGAAAVDEGLTELLQQYPLTPAGALETLIWYGLPLPDGGVRPDGGMETAAYAAAQGRELSRAEVTEAFGMGSFLRGDYEAESVLVWANGARYCQFRSRGTGISGMLHYIPKGCFYPLLHFAPHPQREGWAYDSACGEQVYLVSDTQGEYPTGPRSYVLCETDAAYVVIEGLSEPAVLEALADAVDFTKLP